MSITNKKPETIIKDIGDTLVFYVQNNEKNYIIGGEQHSAKVCFIKSSSQKDHKTAENWMGSDGECHVLNNNFDDVYIIPNYYSDRMNNKILKLFIKTTKGNFVHDLYIDNLINYIIGSVTIGSDGKLNGGFKFAQKGSSLILLPITESTINISANKVKKSELEIGRLYFNSRNKFLFLGYEDKNCVFLTSEYSSLCLTKCISGKNYINGGVLLAEEKTINISSTTVPAPYRTGHLISKYAATGMGDDNRAVIKEFQDNLKIVATIWDSYGLQVRPNYNDIKFYGYRCEKGIPSGLLIGEHKLSQETVDYLLQKFKNRHNIQSENIFNI